MWGMGLAAHALNPEHSTHARAGNSIQRHPGGTFGAERAAFAQKVNAQLLLCSKILLCVLFPHQALRDHLGNLWGHDLPPPGVPKVGNHQTSAYSLEVFVQHQEEHFLPHQTLDFSGKLIPPLFLLRLPEPQNLKGTV